MNPFITFAGGYLRDPDALDQCSFCPYRSADQLLASNSNIFYDHRWRNLGLMLAYIVFNVCFLCKGRSFWLTALRSLWFTH